MSLVGNSIRYPINSPAAMQNFKKMFLGVTPRICFRGRKRGTGKERREKNVRKR